MLCPNCNTALSLAERKGIEIDFCPQCRGIWLDRGELDKIIERSVAEMGAVPAPQNPPHAQPRIHDPRHDPRHYPDSHGAYGHRKKHKSFLSDLFDF